MKSRRDFLKTTATVAVALPFTSASSLALAGTFSGTLSMKEGVELRKRPQFLSDFIIKWINRNRKRGFNAEENEQLDSYLKKNPRTLRREVDKTVKQLTSGKFEELPDEEFASIRIKIKLNFKPPDNFGIGIEISW